MKPRSHARYLVLAAALAAPACGDATGPELTYQDVSGVYSGMVVATTVVDGENIYLQSIFRLILNQNRDQLSGTVGSEGTLSDDFGTVIPVQGVNSISGSIAPGPSPRITITEQNLACPNAVETYQLQYTNGIITGTITSTILGENCLPVLVFPNISVALQTG